MVQIFEPPLLLKNTIKNNTFFTGGDFERL